MRLLAEWIQHESWEKVFDGNGSSGMAEKLIELVEEKMEDICPLEEVKISHLDGNYTGKAPLITDPPQTSSTAKKNKKNMYT